MTEGSADKTFSTPACDALSYAGNHRIKAYLPARPLSYPLCNAMESGYQCAACGEWNATSVDESAGRRQSYVEDCQVCCKPNVLRIEYDNSSQEFFITAHLE
ncbi:MAG: CPXCG motif-containing cysteine-rich protein [Candidatus Sulfotelmatobacter sp.]